MPKSPSLSLRFDEEATHVVLREAAEKTGLSMNRLAQDAIAIHLRSVSRVLEERLEKSLEDLRAYRGRWSEKEIAAFARAEVENDDPLRGRMVESGESDPFGVVAAFADPLER
jgi:hypothetical protein